MRTVIYTFKSFKKVEALTSNFDKVFVLCQINIDLLKLFEYIQNNEVDLIIGIALTKYKSKIEGKTINVYNKSKKVSINGKEEYPLYIPKEVNLKVNERISDTFCNLSIYKVTEMIKENDLPIQTSFIHIKYKDLPLLISEIKTIA